MSLDSFADEPLTTSQAAKRPMTLPAACEWIARQTGRPVPATSTVWRWTLKGVRGGVRLESFRIGGTTYTTPEMISRFIERTSQTATVAVDVSPDGICVRAESTHDRRREQIAAAQQRLKKICAPRRRGRCRAAKGEGLLRDSAGTGGGQKNDKTHSDGMNVHE